MMMMMMQLQFRQHGPARINKVMTCHDCLAQLINRHTALEGMCRLQNWVQVRAEVRRLGQDIDKIVLKNLDCGGPRYERSEAADDDYTDFMK